MIIIEIILFIIQFQLDGVPPVNKECTSITNTGNYDCLRMQLILRRQFRFANLSIFIKLPFVHLNFLPDSLRFHGSAITACFHQK